MNREEAISFLKQVEDILLHNNSWLESTHNPIKESFDMAIEALKICNDCVWYKERSHGEWINKKLVGDCSLMNCSECSNCGFRVNRYENFFMNFCPNCGANMKGEKNDE